jgi:hypothetical protein
MAKKKDTTPAEDLIHSLLDDVKDDSSSGNESLFSHLNESVPVGLNPEGIDKYQGPSVGDGEYQAHDDVINPNATTAAVDDKTIPLPPAPPSDKTAPAARAAPRKKESEKVITPHRTAAPSVMVQVDASLVQAENLKFAQQRLLELEREVDELRQQNEEISSAAEIVKNRIEELTARENQLLKEKEEGHQNSINEITILKGQLQYKETELAKAQRKIEEYEHRLKSDFRKVRVRERELENRLELVKAEKSTLVRAKDDAILELKRKTDQLQNEIDNYREKCLELNKTLENHKEQFKRTVRALKLALTNLEAKEDDVIPLKKAE